VDIVDILCIESITSFTSTGKGKTMGKKTKLTRTQINRQVCMIAAGVEGLLSFGGETLQKALGVTREEARRKVVALLRRLTEEI